MHSVTSNAVAESLSSRYRILECGVFSPQIISAGSHIHTEITLARTYKLGANMGFMLTPVSYLDTAYITATGHWGANGQSASGLTQTNKLTIYITNTYSGASQSCGSYWAIYGKDSDIVS